LADFEIIPIKTVRIQIVVRHGGGGKWIKDQLDYDRNDFKTRQKQPDPFNTPVPKIFIIKGQTSFLCFTWSPRMLNAASVAGEAGRVGHLKLKNKKFLKHLKKYLLT
jgi:hypothetical protein